MTVWKGQISTIPSGLKEVAGPSAAGNMTIYLYITVYEKIYR